MEKLVRKSNKVLAGMLSLALLLGVFAAVPEVKADTGADDETVEAAIEPRITASYSYSVIKDKIFKMSYQNPNTQNAINLYIFAKPDSPKDSRVLVEVYSSGNMTQASFITSKTFVEGESGASLKVSVPKNATYWVKISTDSDITVRGTLSFTR